MIWGMVISVFCLATPPLYGAAGYEPSLAHAPHACADAFDDPPIC
jgi:hypothetical protein